MTEQEALKRLRDILDEATADENSICYVTDYDETPLKLAIESLEKQIPMAPSEVNDEALKLGGIFDWCCSKCGTHHRNDFLLNYCSECGQAIKWEQKGGAE